MRWSCPTTGGSWTAWRPTSWPGRATEQDPAKWFWFEGNFALYEANKVERLGAGGGPSTPGHLPQAHPRLTPKKPKTRQLNSLTGAGAMGGMFWGMLFGLIFLVPLLGAAIGAATGANAGSLTDVGIHDSFIKSARDKVTPGTSALFLMSSDVVTDKVKAAFEEGGEFKPELIQSNLSNEQEAALREMIAS